MKVAARQFQPDFVEAQATVRLGYGPYTAIQYSFRYDLRLGESDSSDTCVSTFYQSNFGLRHANNQVMPLQQGFQIGDGVRKNLLR